MVSEMYFIFKKGSSGGFTMLEIAVVLVVIGLLVGGVLQGQELIKQSSVRVQAAQIESLSSAANIFAEKYDYLPGDIIKSKADEFGISSPAGGAWAMDALGNGEFDYITDQAVVRCAAGNLTKNWAVLGEPNYFFINLAETKLIGGIYQKAVPTGPTVVGTHFPYAKIGGGIFIATLCSNSNNGFLIGFNNDNLTGSNSWGVGSKITGAVTADWAKTYDTKYDDGRPGTGRIFNIQNFGSLYYIFKGVNSGVSTDCSPSFEYNISNPQKNCSLFITVDF